MPDETLRLAYFARGLDGLFLPPVEGCEAFALLRGDSPEESWAGQFVPRERALVYRERGLQLLDPYPSTGDSLLHSDVARVLRRHKIGALLLSSSFTPQVREWGQRHGVRILAPDYELQRRLENKLWFDRFLARQKIPRPESGIVVAGKTGPTLTRRASEGVVVQRADSMGGEGTFYLDSLAEWPALAERLQLPRGERCLVRQFIAGRPLGISVFVAPGVIALSAVRLQCYYPQLPGQSRRLFAGIQWLSTRELSARLKGHISAVFKRLGLLLYRRRYLGFANFDFLADESDRVWLIECNPRMSAATPQLLANPALSRGVPLGQLLLGNYRTPQPWPRQPQVFGFPPSDFAGATLDLTSQAAQFGPVKREMVSGPRRQQGGHYSLYSLAVKWQLAMHGSTLGMILADFPLYDSAGELASAGQRVVSRFRYT